MIYNFLDKETKRLEEELNEHKKNLSNLQMKKEENKRFIHLLTETINKKCAGFTPYEITREEELKIAKLKQENVFIDEQINELEEGIIEQEAMLLEYKKVLDMARDLEKKN